MLDVSVGIPIEEPLTQNVVLQLEGLRSTDQDWIVSLILSYIYSYRIAQNHRGEILRKVVVGPVGFEHTTSAESVSSAGIA